LIVSSRHKWRRVHCLDHPLSYRSLGKDFGELHVDHNRRHYESSAVAARYMGRAGLQAAEAALLERYRGDIAGRRILDLGVGGGRTTPFLLSISPDYVGVDYSREMIEHCRARFPQACLQVADARDLSCFPDRSFDFVLFSHSGIDAVDHDGRLRVLGEVRRVLSDRALFIFSSHNRNFPIPKPWDAQHFAMNPLRSPFRFGRRIAACPVGIVNYVRRARFAQIRDEYCVSVDSAAHYSLVHYRIAAAAQKEQLERAGFNDIVAFNCAGRPLSWSEAEASRADPWYQYACRRRP
jgi:SAM-dependent methyltransferase